VGQTGFIFYAVTPLTTPWRCCHDIKTTPWRHCRDGLRRDG